MKCKVLLLGIMVFFSTPLIVCSSADHPHKSKYAGQEKREIKSLSESDIEELKNGGGWGFAKAAELNGYPGPIHVLEMKKEINLSAQQVKEIEDVYQRMKNQAIPLGLQLIELERSLNNHFANGTITDNLLQELLGEIAQVRKNLRYTHLSAHLTTPNILTAEQVTLYNELRGYASKDPCKNIPKGHDPEMWKKHHDCP
ncbi:Spy/CpxP family protein refolding chaperone [Thermodesulfobacteriota bacterium]